MINFLLKIMAIDSTTKNEADLANYIIKNLKPSGAKIETQKINNKQKNIFFKWGKPKIIFCTHLDTVPPYLPPHKKGNTIYGRGACDAKGQIAVMLEVCKKLYKEKQNDFGLLLLAGEETNSIGAKTANKLIKGSKYIIIGEPTERKIIKAAKGNVLVDVTIKGQSAHSGYPKEGINAIEKFGLFSNELSKTKFPNDKILGKTTFNMGELQSTNATNVISDEVTCKLLFRTTFNTHDIIKKTLDSCLRRNSKLRKNIKLEYLQKTAPMNFFTVPSFKTGVVSFGSDAPHLKKLGKVILYGPGNILDAHTKNEKIKISEIKKAVEDLKKLYHKLNKNCVIANH